MATKKSLMLVTIMIMVVSLLAGCTAPAAAPAADTTKTLVFIPGQLANPSQAFGWKMFQKHAADYGFEVSVLDGGGDVQVQTKAINDAVAQKPDVLMVNPNDAVAIAPVLKAAKDAGVVVGLFMVKNAPGTDDSINFYATVDDVQAGQFAADAIQKEFPNGATGVEVGGQAGHDAAIRRHDGFANAIAGTNITVLDYKNPQQWDTAQAQAIMEDFITKYGDQIQFVFCHWDNGATGVINALTAANKTDVMIVAVDGNKVAYQQVQSWPNYISIGQNAETIAMKSMEMANLFLKKDAAAKIDVIVPFDIITKDTYKNFTPPEW
jgi:ABC-type sugar transport system substrate-binding protein